MSGTVRVWCPTAGRVDVVQPDGRAPMVRDSSGWWQAALPGDGRRYAFVIEGGPPLPDPRSSSQPDGVHGLSKLVDHGKFEWTDNGFRAPPLAAAIIYELHIGTFSPEGTFEGAIQRLDYLVDLGVTHIELMPVAEFSGSRGWGYDGVALFAPHHAYGGPKGLKRLVDAAHAKGLAVLIDVVYNHLGPDGNYLGRFGPYFTERYNTPWGPAMNFDDAGADEVRRFLCDNALMWLRDYHADGLRLDAVHAMFDRSAVHFLEQLAAEVRELEGHVARPLVLIAESDLNDPRVIRPAAAGGYGIDAQWADDFHHAVHAALTGEQSEYYVDFGPAESIARSLQQGFALNGTYSRHRQRTHGRPAPDVSGRQLVACLQNHDQVGNRAFGERLVHLVGADAAKLAAALLFFAPFVPLLFQGEEWGATTPFLYFTDFADQNLAQAVREGRRREFASHGGQEVPDPQANDTFERSRLRWEEAKREPHAGLLNWYRDLIALRKAEPSLTDGRMDRVRATWSDDERWLVVERGSLALGCNLAEVPRQVPLPSRARTVALASTSGIEIAGDAIGLPAVSAAILVPP
jgi:maltooligosyltrehalose trehalohydrolase